MSVVFLDTNALVKLYRVETGSTWLRNFVSGQQIVISELALFEIISTVRRLYIESLITRLDAKALAARMSRRIFSHAVIPVGGNDYLELLTKITFSLPDSYRIRTLDSIQLTAAELALDDVTKADPTESFTFVSSDIPLLRAAQARGFSVENPENHP